MTDRSAEDIALSKAKIRIIGDSKVSFYANIMMGLKYVWEEGMGTAAIDGITMFIDPKFFMSLDEMSRKTVILHEIEHVWRHHIGKVRMGDRDPMLYNIAGDHVINNNLLACGYGPISWTDYRTGAKCNWVCDPKYANMSTEDVYADLYQEQQTQGGGGLSSPTQGNSGSGNPVPFDDISRPAPTKDDGTPMSETEIQGAINDLILSAATAARANGNPGSIPGEVQVFIDSLMFPKLPLPHLLRQFFQVVKRGGFTWARPNRRLINRYYLPSRRGKALLRIAIAMDLSASVSNEEIRRYLSEIANIFVTLKPTQLDIIQFDASIRSVDTVPNLNALMNMELKGRGGTCIAPVMQWAAENKPHALVVFSDGEFRHYNDNPGVPILWLIHPYSRKSNWKAPYGQVILFDPKE
ncbi:HNH endonuclease [Pseudomonas phage vB_Pae575P-3]|uniref:Metallopeptidase domain protein n=1 Tax=Pseudomonas phage vB_Pae575P-3 TaxID=1868829 RepID=A0A1X9I8F3_9CAUD|nr:HNH endonuclease [Pseudomonas phage vB_Pae575P-3]ANT44314.1 hypothetical protein vB_Pae575P-3_35 [Pseudomonas phage vB_Pae575P-3]ANT44405.1 hypothetical protein vB_Pae1369P-5_35 [Pseudomonas phage vB_Pae1396P-5]